MTIPTESTAVPSFTYWCFISYKQLDNRDEHRMWATWLHQQIEHYEVPAELVGKPNNSGDPIPARIYPVFRDEESLAAEAHLGEGICDALEQSRTMLVLCSPGSAASAYVEKEIQYFQQLGRASRIITAIIDGEPNDSQRECFPEPLRLARTKGTPLNLNNGPLAADFRLADGTEGYTSLEAYRLTLLTAEVPKEQIKSLVEKYDARLQLMKLKILAGILDVDLEKLRNRDKAYQLTLARKKAATLRNWLFVVTILALLAIAGAWISYHLQRVATRNFEAAKDVTDGLVTEITKNLADVEGVKADAVRRILTSTEATYDKLLQSMPDNPEVIKGKARMYNEFVTTYLKVGDTDSLLKAAEHSLHLTQKLLDQFPEETSLDQPLGMSLMKVGDALREGGQLERAEAIYEQSLAVRQKISARNPDDLESMRQVSMSLVRLAEVHEARGDFVRVASRVEASVALRRAMIEKGGAQNRDLLVGLVWLLDVRLQAKDMAGVDAISGETESLASQLYTSNPTNSRDRRNLAIVKQRIGSAFLEKGEFEMAQGYFEESLGHFTALSDIDSTSNELKQDRAIGLLRLGLLAKAMGDIPLAYEKFGAAVDLGKVVVSASPGNHQWNTDLAEIYLEWGRIESGEKRRELFAAAKEILVRLKGENAIGVLQHQWLGEIEAASEKEHTK